MEPSTPLQKFPAEIWENIFSCLGDADTQTLIACREACKDFANWVDKKTSFWSRMSMVMFRALNNSHVDRRNNEFNLYMCRRILQHVPGNPTNHDSKSRRHNGQTLLDLAASLGHADI